MEKKRLIAGLATGILLFTNIANADFFIHTADNTSCKNLAGDWVGTGKASNWLLGDCNYSGKGTMSQVDGTDNITLFVVLDKISGGFFCSNHTYDTLHGTCNKGNLVVKTTYGNLTGDANETSGHLQGTLSIEPGIDVKVTSQFHKVS